VGNLYIFVSEIPIAADKELIQVKIVLLSDEFIDSNMIRFNLYFFVLSFFKKYIFKLHIFFWLIDPA
jgi:hypothetical protein